MSALRKLFSSPKVGAESPVIKQATLDKREAKLAEREAKLADDKAEVTRRLAEHELARQKLKEKTKALKVAKQALENQKVDPGRAG
jgi:hypothetical protein